MHIKIGMKLPHSVGSSSTLKGGTCGPFPSSRTPALTLSQILKLIVLQFDTGTKKICHQLLSVIVIIFFLMTHNYISFIHLFFLENKHNNPEVRVQKGAKRKLLSVLRKKLNAVTRLMKVQKQHINNKYVDL